MRILFKGADILAVAEITVDESLDLARTPGHVQAQLAPHIAELNRRPVPPYRPVPGLHEQIAACQGASLLTVSDDGGEPRFSCIDGLPRNWPRRTASRACDWPRRTARSPTTGGGGTRQGYVPMFLAGFAEADILGTCDMHVTNAAALGCGTIALDGANGILPHIHTCVGLKEHSTTAYTNCLVAAKVQFLTDMTIVEVDTPEMTRPHDRDLYDVPLLRFG